MSLKPMKPLMYNGRKINKTATMFSTDVGNVLVNQMNGIKHSDLLNNLADRIDEKKLNLPNGVKYNFSPSMHNDMDGTGLWELELKLKNNKTDKGLVLRETFNPKRVEFFLYPHNYSKGQLHSKTLWTNTNELKRKRNIKKLDRIVEEWFNEK